MTSRMIVCSAILVSASAEAQPLSLEQTRAFAAEHAAGIARARLVVDDTDAALTVHHAGYDPQLQFDATSQREREQPRRTAFSQLLSRDLAGVSAALVWRLPAGGDLRVAANLARERATTRVLGAVGHEDIEETTFGPRFEVRLQQPLWGGRRTNAAIGARLTTDRDAAIADRRVALAATLRDAEHAYWQLYLAGREVSIRGAARLAAEAQLAQVNAEIARGARPRLAAIEIEDALARLREDELIATGSVRERSLELARAIGMPPTTELTASDPPPPASDEDDGELAQLAGASLRVASAGAELARARDESRWRIDAIVGGTVAAPRDTLAGALSDTAAYGGWTIELGLSVRAPVTDRGARAKLASARARLEIARIAERELVAELATETERLRSRRAVARQRIRALARAVELATANLTAERNRWERGDTTAFELLRRQSALADVELRLERAKVDELDATAALRALFGTAHFERSASSARRRS